MKLQLRKSHSVGTFAHIQMYVCMHMHLHLMPCAYVYIYAKHVYHPQVGGAGRHHSDFQVLCGHCELRLARNSQLQIGSKILVCVASCLIDIAFITSQ